MDKVFNSNVFHGHLGKGNVKDAMAYLAQFPEQEARHQQYKAVFEREEYPVFKEDEGLNELLLIYRKYYRDVFYLQMDAAQAEEAMRERFVRLLNLKSGDASFGDIEAREIAQAFEKKGYHFLGGKTGGYWGPYIWKTTETKTYDVELPDGRQPYPVRFLEGFISRSWYDAISFGEAGTGGWTDGDGIIHCVKAAYDLEDESFTVSLLRHEAQHAMDLARYSRMSSEELEYRAKLVELIYSEKRNLLEQFAYEADRSKANNGHSLAASRIVEEFGKKLGREEKPLCDIPIARVQAVARELLALSNREIKKKYAET